MLVVEDTEEIADVLEAALAAAGMEVTVATSGPDGLVAAAEHRPDVVILDLNLPGLDGLEVCRQLRTTSDTYVLMLTARTDEIDRIVGLSVGADDYVTKPFSPREVLARVQAMLRRPRAIDAVIPAAQAPAGQAPAEARPSQAPPAEAAAAPAAPATDARSFGALCIDPNSREVTVSGAPIPLTKLEFDLLDALSENPGWVLSRPQLRDRVWGGDWLADDHAVDVHMSNLRRKLRAAGAEDPIATVRGVGYRIQAS